MFPGKRVWAVALALLLRLAAPAAVRPLTILHLNDLHAHISPSDERLGGFAYLATAIRLERAQCRGCIFLNAGDLVQGTPVSTIFHGQPVFEMANLLGFDAATLGNHDFDYGWMQTRKFMQTAKYPMVSANVAGAGGRLFAKPYVILNANGLRVAVIGALTDQMERLELPAAMGEWHTVPVVEAVRRYAAELKSQSDLVVLLGHLTGAEEKEFLENVPEIPVIVSGHLHTGLNEAMTHEGRVLVRVKGYGVELGRLDLQVDTEKKAPVSWTWKRIPIDASKIQPAGDVAPEVKKWEGRVSARVDRPIAVSKRAFTKSELKPLIEQAMRDETGADFAYLNTGGVRDVLPVGQLLERHIWDIMPFDDRVVVAKVRGRDLPVVVLGGRTVEPDREYTLVVSDFTADNQESQLHTSGLKFENDVGLLRDMLLDWFRKKKTIE
ncbi:MAG TPA: bifunctional UDP-sugar hydrolase/5'-nucleotidase [Bryobacteraceae bacterium]|nr:bifunctional UDP-sugar hydrolase/5'-nucleotidase [Bryobacteraceae bacterium]